MPHNRYFTTTPLNQGASLSLEGGEFHHLAHVMRAQVGDSLELVNGKGDLASARVEKIEKKSATLLITSLHHEERSQRKIILAQALPRASSLEWILEKGTELGADAFWLFPGMRSEKKSLAPTQFQRLLTHLISAMKQCGRLDLPELLLKPPLIEWSAPPGLLLFGDTRPTAHPLPPLKNEQSTLFFIGPEKGFDPKELHFLEETLHATGVKLHKNTLRVETAALTALIQSHLLC
jgi:16S rRNA (uracil1498-N3)-methyltransferase